MKEFHVASRETTKGKKRVFVDIDETICFYKDSNHRRYDLAIPSQLNIDKINSLYDNNWEVTYWTARGSVSGKDYTEFTRDQLIGWGCKFDNLITGTTSPAKPHFDMVIDDKAKRIEEL